jgi:hypothetical protein
MSWCRGACNHRPVAALLHRQPGLSAVERLDLRLLVERQHLRVLGRVDIEVLYEPDKA